MCRQASGVRVLSDIVKRGSIRKVVATQVAANHIQALLDRAPIGSISKQAGLSVNADQESVVRNQVSGNELVRFSRHPIPDT
jgi:phosphoglucomutase